MAAWSAQRILGTAAVWLLVGLLAGGCGTGEGAGSAGPAAQVQAVGSSPAPAGLPPIPAPPPLGRDQADLLVAGQSGSSAPRPDPGGTLYLENGWNLVSWGVAHLDSVSADAAVHPTLFAYNSESGSYQPVELGAPAINAAGASRGYWAFASHAATIRYDGTGSVTDAGLLAGWNLVGLPGVPVTLGHTRANSQAGGDPLALPQAVSPNMPPPAGCLAYSRGFAYAPSGGQYEVVDLADPGTRTAAGRAVWVYAHAPATVSWLPGPPSTGVPGSGPPAAGADQPPPDAPEVPGPPAPPQSGGPNP